MESLRQYLPETLMAFESEMFGISTTITAEKRRSYLSAFDFDHPSELESHRQIISEGLSLFSEIFNTKSKTFIAPNYVWHRSLESTLLEGGVNYIQGSFSQVEPNGIDAPIRISHRMGESNQLGQIYLTRNASFEPALIVNTDPVSACLRDISIAFRWGKPAVISSHRVNYIGSINENNRKQNLQLLSYLLRQIIVRWHDVEFLNSQELGNIVTNNTLN